MKKFRFPVIAVILAIAFSAFTNVKQTVNTRFDDPLYWFEVSNQSTQTPGAYDALRLRSAEQTASGCFDVVSTHCRYGYTSDQLNFDQFGNPTSVKQNETPVDIITKTSN